MSPTQRRLVPASGWRPRASRPPLGVAVVLVLAALLSASTMLRGINPHDEGLVLGSAARIADGQWPYRDFYANYGPGQYVLVAGLFKLFGPSLLSWRVLRVVLDVLVAVGAYGLARRPAPAPLAVAAGVAAAAVMAYPSVPGPNPTALALAFGAVALARRSPVAAGALAGVAIAFRLDVGLGALAGAMLAAPHRRAAARAALSTVAVAVVLLAPVLVVAPREFYDQTIRFGFTQQGLQRLPLPGLDAPSAQPNLLVEYELPWILLAGLALWALVTLRQRAGRAAWALAPLALAGLWYLRARADVFHLAPLAVVLPILLAGAAAREHKAGRRLVAGVLAGLVGLIALQGLDRKRLQIVESPPLRALRLPVADGVQVPEAEAAALEGLARDVGARVPPGQPIFVANPRHDLVKVGDPLVYTLVGRPNPTRYDVFQPGVITTAPVQREVVADLRRARPRLIVRWESPLADQPEPNGAGRSSGVRILDSFLARTYRPERRFGPYAVLVPRAG